jgi:site-specific recombinase XerC
LVEGEEMTRHPMDQIRRPTQPEKLVPIVADDELSRLLATCAGKSFADRRDMAIIRLLLDTGSRLSLLWIEAGGLRMYSATHISVKLGRAPSGGDSDSVRSRAACRAS